MKELRVVTAGDLVLLNGALHLVDEADLEAEMVLIKGMKVSMRCVWRVGGTMMREYWHELELKGKYDQA